MLRIDSYLLKKQILFILFAEKPKKICFLMLGVKQKNPPSKPPASQIHLTFKGLFEGIFELRKKI